MKKLTFILTLFFLFFSCSDIYAMPSISAKSGVVLEAGTNRVLYSKNMNRKLPMASTTKVMTCLLALEKGNLEDVVYIKKEYTGIEGTSIYLREGEKLKLNDLLYGLMLCSGNDAAVAIAGHIGGNVKNFINMMNKRAKELGCKNTHFENPNGLPNDNHYTTAYDLSIIASKAMEYEKFQEIITTKYKKMSMYGKANQRVVYNKNKLLKRYKWANGIKTGYTKKAGKCFIMGAKKDGMQLVGVVLSSYDHYTDSITMLDYCFNNYEMKNIMKQGEYLESIQYEDSKDDYIKLVNSDDLYYPLSENENYSINLHNAKDTGEGVYEIKYDVNVDGKNMYSSSICPNVEFQRYDGLKEWFKRLRRGWL